MADGGEAGVAFTVETDSKRDDKESVLAHREALRQKMVEKHLARQGMAKKRVDRSGRKAGDQFLDTFMKDVRRLEEEITGLSKETENVDSVINRLKKELGEKLRVPLADKTVLLTPFHSERLFRKITELTNILNKKKRELSGVKFKFRRKKRKVKAEVKPKAVEEDELKMELDVQEESLDAVKDDDLAKYLEDNELKIENKADCLIVKKAGEIDGSDVHFDNIKGCTIVLADMVGAVRMNNISDCKVYIGACASSLLIHGVSNSTFHIALRQARIHNAKDTRFFLHVTSQPIIEHSSGCHFGPFAFSYPDLAKHWECIGHNPNTNRYQEVLDFQWLAKNQSPNWSLVSDSECEKVSLKDVLSNF